MSSMYPRSYAPRRRMRHPYLDFCSRPMAPAHARGNASSRRLRCFECRTRLRRKFLLQKRPCRHLVCLRCVNKYTEQEKKNCVACKRETGQDQPVLQWFAPNPEHQQRFDKDVSGQVQVSSSEPSKQQETDELNFDNLSLDEGEKSDSKCHAP